MGVDCSYSVVHRRVGDRHTSNYGETDGPEKEELMDKFTLEEFNERWVYEVDKVDGWSVTTQGDCDDYALSVAWIMADYSWIKFWFNVWTFRTTFHRVHTGLEPHIVLRHKGQYIDNITKEWQEEHSYRPIFPWVWLAPFVVLKMMLGKVFK